MKKFQHDSRARVTRARVTHRRTLRLTGRLWRARPVRRPPTAGRRAQSVRGLLTAGRCACPAGYSGLSGGYSRRARTSRGCAPQRASWDRGGPPLSHGPNPGAGAACINAGARPAVRGAACINAGTRSAVRGAADESFLAHLFFKKGVQGIVVFKILIG